MLDLGPQLAALGPELEAALRRVLRSGRYLLGPEIEAFERECAAYLGVRHAIGLASGTDALVIGLRALGIGPGDEVIVPSFTFFATAEAVSLLGAIPVFADLTPETFCIDPEGARAAIGPRTRAIVPVHLFGHPAEMDPLLALARERGLLLLEDAAQAIGATYRGRRCGGLGAAAVFSFYPSKNLGALGDGGLLATDDGEVAERARLLRNHGSPGGYRHERIGYCSRLDELQAAALRVKLPHLDAWNEARRRVADAYRAELHGVAGLALPREAPGCRHVYHVFTIRLPADRRDAVREALAKDGIASTVYYPEPIHRALPYARAQSLPETERAAREVLSLPIWPELDRGQVARVASGIKHAL
jgi:dTDP-4-amino-4,6-dideoxygalactose transaminase